MLRKTRFLLRALTSLVLFAVLVDAVYLAQIWPDWSKLSAQEVPKSRFIDHYSLASNANPDLPPLRWQPVPFSHIPQHLVKAVLIAEDIRFYSHSGFDFAAIRDAMRYNWERKKVSYGASTISQQTAKNLFLTPARSALRKWHELVLTIALEAHLEKQRILEIYLNVAQFGQGIYGVEAATQFYWGSTISRITISQAAELAAALPSPVKANPATRTSFFKRKRDKIERRLIAVLDN